ncbi:MAG: ABC transporter permease [Deltaproteobacteria bacterium]|nr:ABC transporter permease [Deltaproteobacteria bacterium]MBI3294045.1 ABC transporter permease [Deltaproteobacteria bacterium]
MLIRFKIALRNCFRNRRRSLLNISMIAGGVCAIILFRGFASRLLLDVQETTISTQSGQITLADKKFWDQSARSPSENLLPNSNNLTERIRKLPHVKAVAGRLDFYGLLSTSETTLSARGMSVDTKEEAGKLAALSMEQGTALQPGLDSQMMLGAGLAKKLRVKLGDTSTILAYTFDNVVNALDVTVVGVFRSGLAEFDDTTFLVPLASVQRLLDTDKVEQIAIRLDATPATDAVVKDIGTVLAGTTVDVRTWKSLSNLYRQVDSFFKTQNRVIETILLTLILLGVLNTVGMSVLERAGEIGTVRALGYTEGAVLAEFLLEGLCLGILGAVVGVVLGTAIALFLSSLGMAMVVPGASRPVHIRIELSVAQYLIAVTVALLASTLAAIAPALRASRMQIVDALRHNV